MKFDKVMKESSNQGRGGANFDDKLSSRNKVGKCRQNYAATRKYIKSWTPKSVDDITKDDMMDQRNKKKRKKS